MKPIRIKGSDVYPTVILDKEEGIFEVSGVSTPEAIENFYRPIIAWIEEYTKDPNPTTTFIIQLEYFNITTSKRLLFIFYELDKLVTSESSKVEIKWIYEHDDEHMLEAGQDFDHMVQVPFKFIETEPVADLV